MKGHILLLVFCSSCINNVVAMDDKQSGYPLPPIHERKGRFTLRIPANPQQASFEVKSDDALNDSIIDANYHIGQIPGILNAIREGVFWLSPYESLPHLPMMLWRMKKSDVNMNKAHGSLLEIIGRLDYLQREKECGRYVDCPVHQSEQDGALMVEMSTGYLESLKQVNFCLYCARLCTQAIRERQRFGIRVSDGKLKKLYDQFAKTRTTVDEINKNYYSFLQELQALQQGS